MVGGYTRDLFLERPCKDIDILCSEDGIAFAKGFAAYLDKNLEVHKYKNFGTAMLNWDDWQVEFVGARRESYARNSRNPTVEKGTLDDDINRRDFTINALAI